MEATVNSEMAYYYRNAKLHFQVTFSLSSSLSCLSSLWASFRFADEDEDEVQLLLIVHMLKSVTVMAWQCCCKSTSSSRPSWRRKSLKISLWRKQSASSSSSNLKLPIFSFDVHRLRFCCSLMTLVMCPFRRIWRIFSSFAFFWRGVNRGMSIRQTVRI